MLLMLFAEVENGVVKLISSWTFGSETGRSITVAICLVRSIPSPPYLQLLQFSLSKSVYRRVFRSH